MTTTEPTTPSPLEGDKQVLSMLYEDAMAMPDSPERQAELKGVWEFAGDLAMQETIQRQVDEDIARGIELSRARSNNGEAIKTSELYAIKPDTIGWIPAEAPPVMISRKTTQSGKPFWIGRVTEHANVTAVDQSFLPEETMTEVMTIIEGHVATKLDAPDQRDRRLRPLRATDKTKQNTKLTAYSDDGIVPTDGGYRAGDVRALILEDPAASKNGESVFLVASVCRHDQDARKIYQIQGRGK